jgi:hypothetical protein
LIADEILRNVYFNSTNFSGLTWFEYTEFHRLILPFKESLRSAILNDHRK